MSIVVALLLLVVFVVGGASALAQVTHRPALPDRSLTNAFFAWSKQIDASSSELRCDEWHLTFTFEGYPARAVVSRHQVFDGQFESWNVSEVVLTVECPSPNDASITTRLARSRHPLVDVLSPRHVLHLSGEDADLFALCTRNLLGSIVTSGKGWTHASLGDVFRFERKGGGNAEQLVSEFPDMLDLVRQCVANVPVGSTPELLVERVRSSADHEGVRWRAARALLELPGAADAKRELLSELDTLPPSVQATCALWREDASMDDTSYATIVRGRGLDDLTAAIDHRITTRAPWRALFDQRLPWSVRGACAPNALAHAPDDPDDALVDLLVRPLPSDASRPVLLRTLRANGWGPAPEALATLARDAVGSVRHELIRDLQSRGPTADDAPMLAALLARGHGNDVEPIIRDLRARGGITGGQLSVASDTASSGALTASADAHGLSLVDEEGV